MIKQSLQAAAKKMQIDFNDVTSGFNHQGEKGSSREELLVKYLRDYIPSKYQMKNGVLIDAVGNQSRQQDIVIYDSFNSPLLVNMESTRMIPIESVYATIEVKSTLNKTELMKCVDNIKSVKELQHNPLENFKSPNAGFVFAFTSSTSLEAILNNLVESNRNIEKSQQISLVCVLDQGIILNVSKDGFQDIDIIPNENSTPVIIENTAEENLLLFYLILMQYLNFTQVPSPNLFQYANSGDLLKISYYVPGKHIQPNSSLKMGDESFDLDLAQNIVADSNLLGKIIDREASMDEVFLYFSKNLESIINVNKNDNTLPEGNFDFFGLKIKMKDFIKSVDIYTKIENNERLDEEEYLYFKIMWDSLSEHYIK